MMENKGFDPESGISSPVLTLTVDEAHMSWVLARGGWSVVCVGGWMH